MKILVINAGSSSLKYQLFSLANEKWEVLAIGLCERIGIEGSNIQHETTDGKEYNLDTAMPDHTVAVQLVIDALISQEHGVLNSLDEISAVGHRVLHGGSKFVESVVITEKVKQTIRDYFPLGPLHNPANLMGIEACQAAMPNVPMIAVFDTAFHQTMPERAFMYALPYDLFLKHGIRRYGFHGTSHAYVADQAYQMLENDKAKIITCHLGNGSSIAAVNAGKCIDTSMGMTPLAGVSMGTRCGDIDPAIVPFLMNEESLSTQEIDDLMNKESGVLGISGVSSDFRDITKAKNNGNKRAELALDMFYYHCKKYIGAYSAALGGLDAIIFTAGIGENDHNIRANICKDLEYLGVKIDSGLNSNNNKIISASDSKVKVFVINTNEELRIAQDTERLSRRLASLKQSKGI